MKKIVEMHFCDICGCEVTTEARCIVRLGIYNNWSDDAEINEQHEKDLCPDCYKTILQLIGETKVQCESTGSLETQGSNRGKKFDYDKEELKKLWAIGLTYKQIADRLHITRAAVNNVITRMSAEEKQAVKDKYGVIKQHAPEETKRMKVVTDSYGFVQTIEES